MFTNLTNWLRPNAKKPLRRGLRSLSSRIEELEDRRVLDGAYYSLFNNSGVFQQDWTNTNLITANGDWSSVPSILGFNGAGLAPTPGTNPGTIQGAGGANTLTANQTNPGSSSDPGLAPGGIVEFEISNPTIALAGDTTNQAPYLLLHMDTRNAGDVSVSYLIRDIDASSRSTLSPVALQYRVSPDGNFAGINFINVGSQYKADVTSGSGSKADTPVTVTLPNTVNDRQFVQIRIMTANAVSANSGNPDVPDEWIGIDDIEVRGNLQPVVGIASGEVEYLENAAITFVDAGMNLSDIDSNDFNGGKLVVSYGTGPGYTQGTADDRLIVNNQGVGNGNISTTGTIATGLSVQYTTVNGTATIGTVNVNGGVGINSLVVSFTSAEATPTAVRQLLRNIGFLNTSDDPIGGLRKIQFTVSDGDSSTGQTSISVSRDIDVVPVNDEPVVSLDAPLVIPENSAPVILSPNATITDPDSHDYDGGTLTVFIPPASNPTAFDQITILDQGQGTGLVGVQNGNEVTYSGILIGTFTGGTNGTPLVITFNAASNPTPESIQAVARAIQFENTSDDPPTSPRPVRFIAFDNDADIYNTGISANSQVTVTVDVVQYQTQPVDVVAVGVGPGNGSKVRLYNAKTGAFIGGFSAYGPDFQGGVSVAMADINGDGVTDLVVGAGPGGGPHIQVIDGNRFGLLQGLDQIAPPSAMLGNFFGYDFAYRGGVTVAAGDVNGDGKADIILGTGPGGGAHVKIISGAGIQDIGGDYQPVASSILASFLAYDADFRGGVTVATGDMNRDGYFDVLAAAGPGGSSHVKAFSGRKLFEQGPDSLGVLLASFYGYDPNFRGGATVAAGDFNGDGYDDYIVGAGAGGGPHVKVFSPFDLATPIASFFAFEGTMDGGISVGYRMRSGGSTPVLVAGTGSGTHTRVATFAPPSFSQDGTADVFDPLFLGGVDVG